MKRKGDNDKGKSVKGYLIIWIEVRKSIQDRHKMKGGKIIRHKVETCILNKKQKLSI